VTRRFWFWLTGRNPSPVLDLAKLPRQGRITAADFWKMGGGEASLRTGGGEPAYVKQERDQVIEIPMMEKQ
jgi:hypothetical protein